MSADLDDRELLGEFRSETRELLAGTDATFLTLERNPQDKAALNAIFRAFHTVKGNSAYFGLARVKAFAHGVETCLDELRKGAVLATPELIDALLAAKDHLARLVEHSDAPAAVPAERDATLLGLLQQSRSATGDALEQTRQVLGDLLASVREPGSELPELQQLLRRAERLMAATSTQAPPPEARPAAAAASAPAPSQAPAGQAGRTLRIDEARLDTFSNSVGDLLNFAEAFLNLQRNLEEHRDVGATLREWKAANRDFGLLVDRLQQQATDLRQVPVQAMLTKLSRIARDTARTVGKQVQVHLHGAELMIDKSYVEVLEAPLMHLIRNAVDHGLEPPADRQRAGKAADGAIHLRFQVTRDHYELLVEDDGRGIDPQRVRHKAVGKGLLSAAEAERLTDDEAVHLVFRPGFSTAEQVTDLSGRGVGLDVVQDAITRRRGTVRLHSRTGRGTTFAMQLPRATNQAIVESLLVAVGGARFLLPLESLRETFDLQPRLVSTLPEGGDVVTVRDRTLPFVDLGAALGKPRTELPPQAVVVQEGRRCFVLGIDQAIGLQKVAVKPLRDQLVERPWVRGAAILGNGSVGLVLNVAQLAR